MASPIDSMSQYHTMDETMSSNTNSPSTPIPSHLGSHSSPPVKDPKPNYSYVNRPPPGSIAERPKAHEARISQEVLQGLHLLGLDMPQGVAVKVAADYTNMLPMERFVAETCKAGGGAPVQGVVGSPKTSSCQANVGSSKSE